MEGIDIATRKKLTKLVNSTNDETKTSSTDRKEAEESLRANEAYQRQILQTTADGFWVVDNNGRVVEVNNAYCAMSDYTQEEILGMGINDLDAEEKPEATRERIERIIRDGFDTFETRHRRKDGSVFPVEISTSYLKERGGQFVCFCRDITDRKEAEESLREKEALLAKSEEIAHTGSWKLDLTTNRLIWSDEVYLIFGCKPREFDPTYEIFLDLVHPEDRAAVDEAYSRSLLEESDGYDIEHRIVRRNSDEVRYVHERCVHERDASGSISKSTGMVQDITERKQVEAYREMSREVLQVLNEPGDLEESIRRVLATLKARTGFDAVGLRLQEGEDFPYFAEDGFPADFLQTENTLLERGKDGGVCRDKDGKVCLECTCGLVISGKTDSSSPLFTKGGSCWTNESFFLLDLPSDQDPRLHPRNNCIHQGYASVALVPVRTKERIVGLIQLNDKRKDRFTLETVELLEGIAAHIGSALLRKRAENELKENEALVSKIMETSPVGIVTVDKTGNITYANKRAEEILGLVKDQITSATYDAPLWNHTDLDGSPLPDDKQPFNIVKTTMETVYNIQHGITWPDGAVVWLSINASPMKDSHNNFNGMVATLEDITKQKQAEEVLRESEEKFRSIFDSMAEMVVLHELVFDNEDRPVNYRILDCNPAFTGITGIRREDAVGRLATDVYGSDSAPYLDEYARVALTGEPCIFITNHTPMDKRFDVHTASPGKNMFVTVTTDITERKRAEEEREKLQDQLTQAQKMESVGRLAGGVAHDFNNILMGIMGYTDMCRDDIEAAHPIREWLDEITHEAERSAKLTRQLLAFARKQTVAPKVLDLNTTVADMLKMLRQLIGEDIDLSWQPGEGLWPVKLDPGQVDQVLANLCVNARDAIGGVGKVTIETQNVDIDANYCAENAEAVIGSYVMLAISDDGCGMEKETMAQVFEPFFTTKGVGEGTGLGLSTVYGIVKQNGGFVNVYSEPGKGTTFRIYLPRDKSRSAEVKEAVTNKDLIGGSGKILVVEDERAILVSLRMFLERLGYTVMSADCPEEALRLVAEYQGGIDLLITDVVMPGMSGRDLARKLAPDFPSMKVLYMSGYTANVIAHRGILEDDVEFIPKPFSREELAQKVRDVLK